MNDLLNVTRPNNKRNNNDIHFSTLISSFYNDYGVDDDNRNRKGISVTYFIK